MAIDRFKITRTFSRASLKIAGVDVVVDTVYPISQQAQMVASINNGELGVPYDSFEYKLGNSNGVWSQAYTCTLNAQTANNPPVHAEIMINIKLNEITDLTPYFNFDDNTDRICFLSSNPPVYGDLLINGLPVQLDREYFLYEFINVEWHSSHGGNEQAVLTKMLFKVGNANEISDYYHLGLQSSANMFGPIEGSATVTGTLTS